jgi:hypothetical protein
MAVDWQTVSQTAENVRMIDVDTVSKSKAYTKAWTMTTYWSQQTMRGYPAAKYRSLKELSYFNCRERSVFTAQVVFYEREAGEGEVQHSAADSVAVSKFTEVVPGSVGEANLLLACALSKSPRGKG